MLRNLPFAMMAVRVSLRLQHLRASSTCRIASVFPDVPAHQEVFNQIDELGDYNALVADPRMDDCLKHYGADWAYDHAKVVGQVAGSQYMKSLAIKVPMDCCCLEPSSQFYTGELARSCVAHP